MLNPNKQVQMTNRECKACVCVRVSTANRPTVRLLSTLHLQHYKVTWGLLISFSSSIYLSPPLLLHVCIVLSHIPRHNPSEYWRVVAEFRLDLCSADRLHHPGGPLSPSEIVVSAAQYYCHAPQCVTPSLTSRHSEIPHKHPDPRTVWMYNSYIYWDTYTEYPFI